METIRELLAAKGCDMWFIAPEQSVYEALALMAFRNVGSLLVMREGKMVGLLSERDYARKIILKGRTSKDTPVAEIMVRHVVCVRPEQTIHDCMILMTQERVRHTPVVENDRVIGVISIGDVVRAIISRQDFLIEQLETYVTGSPSHHPPNLDPSQPCAGGLNCWEFMHCGREPGGVHAQASGICPATTASSVYGIHNGINGGRVCFAIAGTLCGGELQSGQAEKAEECSRCQFYRLVVDQEGGRLKDSAMILARLGD
jgi:CBS domain-containing protein